MPEKKPPLGYGMPERTSTGQRLVATLILTWWVWLLLLVPGVIVVIFCVSVWRNPSPR
jgi:hypothetical protein